MQILILGWCDTQRDLEMVQKIVQQVKSSALSAKLQQVNMSCSPLSLEWITHESAYDCLSDQFPALSCEVRLHHLLDVFFNKTGAALLCVAS
jgi:hypothetical protein